MTDDDHFQEHVTRIVASLLDDSKFLFDQQPERLRRFLGSSEVDLMRDAHAYLGRVLSRQQSMTDAEVYR